MTKQKLEVSRKLRCYKGPPSEGDRISVSVQEAIRDKDGNLIGASRIYDDQITGTITHVGAHWSNQPSGQSGWWVTVQLDRPPKENGKPVLDVV